MSASDVSDTLNDALTFIELNQVKVQHRPRLLSDNRPHYISGELVDYLKEMAESYARRPLPPTNARKDRTLPSLDEKSNLAQSPLLKDELEEQLHRFVSYYNHDRHHESIDNLNRLTCITKEKKLY